MSTLTERTLPGFANPVHDSQRTFRALLDAMARPTLPQRIDAVRASSLRAPAPLGAGAAAVVLALCDEYAPIWLDPALRASEEVVAWLRFHTGARIVDDAAEALFVVASSPRAVPPLDELMLGTDEDPHLSATVVVDATGVGTVGALRATGPGVDGEALWDGAGLSEALLAQHEQQGGLFPRGVDLILVAGDVVRAIPRTTVLERTAPARTAPGSSAHRPTPERSHHRAEGKDA